ncbi:protein phosphatase CheZ [Janthinobacterium agaricidamnosum]|uniref:Protein phosphatase CheZ n=1 Tax=Janthinobacterium agaricidamnosum NBRC 102515 = DSM 9628 TaxID=1349767 RepID=W0V009_9BURK|nr:protein phosphatase CheZ [Janthinobacterium agaricidamnosum]CDG82164.1 protein phosphatase CheZ [Janthinobacterium agaricidamnosum NBRC 102515 = DSM 9628]
MSEIETGRAVMVDGADAGTNEEFLRRIGQMTRALHDSLRGLGLDKLIEKAASEIPDVRDRLDYVARMSEQAAQKVLNATDAAGPMQDTINANAKELSASWQGLIDGGASEQQWRTLAAHTVATLADTSVNTSATKAHLMEIMMAQDFQDLTGQVIKKVTSIAQNLEQQLVQMLVDFAPAEMRRELDNGLLNGPQINPTAPDVVSDQGQVDDLLDSLGF